MKTKLRTFARKQILGKPIKKLVKKWLKYSIPMTRASDISRKKNSKISRDFQGQIREKIGRFRGKKVKIRGTIGWFRAIFVGEKSKCTEKSAHFAGL